MFKKTIFESPATCRPHFESRASTSYFTCAWCVCIIVSRSWRQIAKLAKLQLTITCAKCNLAIIMAFFKKKRAIYVFLQSGNTVEKYTIGRALQKSVRFILRPHVRLPFCVIRGWASFVSVGNRRRSVADTRFVITEKLHILLIKKLEKLFNIPSSLAPKVILGVHQANPEVTEAVKKYEVKPSMTPIHAIRDRLLQGLDQDYNVIFCFTSFKSCSPPLTSLPSSSPFQGKSSKTALKT